LGTAILARYLRSTGLKAVTFDDLSMRGEQDPWAFYYCGKQGYCLITSDKTFLDHFTHMVAIQLGTTRVFSFKNGNAKMKRRGEAFVRANAKILRVIKKREAPFVASIGLSGEVTLVNSNPMPTKKLCRPEHWESYVRVCKAEGVEIHEEAYTVPGSTCLPRRLTSLEG
jgi:predicted nuclease of predicted toxin-antitoxin system